MLLYSGNSEGDGSGNVNVGNMTIEGCCGLFVADQSCYDLCALVSISLPTAHLIEHFFFLVIQVHATSTTTNELLDPGLRNCPPSEAFVSF